MQLDETEEQLIQFILEGNSIPQIASRLNLTESQAQDELKKLYQKFGVESKLELLVAYKQIEL